MNQGFFNKVYDVVRQIPYGRVTSYGAVAEFLGSKGSARIVGWAMNSTRNSPVSLPAHRVVNRNGLLTGKKYFGGTELMKNLLESEGLIVEDDQIKNFREKFWDPAKEIS